MIKQPIKLSRYLSKEIGRKNMKADITTKNATKVDIMDAARKVYAYYPEILKSLGL
ncbi:hypothetical protein [Lacihabitans soyangensis]|uniref:hypothetical protein n=1 Tax=Lacihabitans soyangensis TaxID=869394 RepID=UPI0020CF273A|nr:hypothetical protein [Lacihabitans soyangensis]